MRNAAVLLCLALLCAARSCPAANTIDLGKTDDVQSICVTAGNSVRIYETEVGLGNALFVDHVPSRSPANLAKDGTLSWFDSTATRLGRHTITTVHTMRDGTMTIDRRYIVVVTDAPPITIDGMPASSVMDIPVKIQSKQSGSFAPSILKVILDGSTQILSQPAGQDTALLKLQGTPSGQHAYQFEAVDTSGVIYFGPTYSLQIPDRLTVTMAPNYVYAAAGNLAPLSVSIAPGIRVASVSYTIDGQPAGNASLAPYAATSDMSQFQAGQHTVIATLTDTLGNKFDSPPFTLNFTNKAQDDAAAQLQQDTQYAVNHGLLAITKVSVAKVRLRLDQIRMLGPEAEYGHWVVTFTVNDNYGKQVSGLQVADLNFYDSSTETLLTSLDSSGQLNADNPPRIAAYTSLDYSCTCRFISKTYDSRKPAFLSVWIGGTNVKVPLPPVVDETGGFGHH